MDSLADWSWPKKESVSLKISQQKFSKLKCKEGKKKNKPTKRIMECNTNIIGIAEREERELRKYVK